MAWPFVGNMVRGVLEGAAFLVNVGISPPWQVAISIVGGRGYSLQTNNYELAPRPFLEDLVHLPVRTVAAIEQVANSLAAGKLLKPAVDVLGRTVGWEFNSFYDDNDNLTVRV
jgi:hypothetical protein